MRLLVAPALVASTIGVLATGVALLAVGPGGGIFLCLDKASFVISAGAFAVHLLAYVMRLPGLVGADWGGAAERPAWRCATGIVALALLAGLIIAVAVLPAAHPWLHYQRCYRTERNA